jgi:hypothetical protein
MSFIWSAAFYVNLAIWSVIGFICWIPLLFRSTAALSAAIMVSTLTQADTSHLRVNYENAVNFYSRGFQTIFNILGSQSRNLQPANGALPRAEIQWDRVLVEFLWSFMFWGTFLFGVYRMLFY